MLTYEFFVRYKCFFRDFFLSSFLSTIMLLRNLLLDSSLGERRGGGRGRQSRSKVWIRSLESAHMYAVVFFLLFCGFDRRTKTFNGTYAASRNGCQYASKRISCRFSSFEFTVPSGCKPLRTLREILNAFLLTIDTAAYLRKLAHKFVSFTL